MQTGEDGEVPMARYEGECEEEESESDFSELESVNKESKSKEAAWILCLYDGNSL